ncbi:HNH endonuclease [Bacillus sp. S35]|uniref:HNH endonuclease domain-containing protein n=1 Tax=Priestia aryabhattai TaxID=412384 RepID=UPI00190DB3C4|nr:HNH endonuclease domain-containing protein [Priestia aryabhattai]MBK0009727.1 HNH endonuclease [Bacillus sp. S35]MCM3644463.1 HNH endonuclease [Priestia aryabhattai]
MDSYIKQWHDLILNCNFDNTYKMVWSKALVELSLDINNDSDKEIIVFDFNEIAKLCLKYYWNQTIYFDLVQSPNLKKPPEIITSTKKLVKEFFSKKGSLQPVRFEKVDFTSLALENQYETTVENIARTLRQDVCWRFKKLKGNIYEIYDLDTKEERVSFHKDNVLKLKIYSDFLFTVINYRWTQMLEGFNYSPRISRKVRAIDEDNIKRGSLGKFHKYLDLMFEDGKRKCFYCGDVIQDAHLSVDHVIPWSYMFSDDLWNLVYCHKGENSKKSNRIPVEEDILQLENRNMKLLERMENKSREYNQLQIAVKKDYVRQFWTSFKG